jgi:outer membrane biosynthesis protein TonB
MASLATHRLIDAAAHLDAADRALLNLWVNRGLDDERLTALTGMSLDALQARREKIVTQLAAALGLPDVDVRGALEGISPEEEALVATAPDGVADEAPSLNGSAAVIEAETQPVTTETQPVTTEAPPATDATPPTTNEAPPATDEASPAVPDEPPPPPEDEPVETPRRRRWLWVGIVAAVLIVAAVIAIVAGGGSSPPAHRTAATTPSTPTTATQTPTVAAPVPAHPTAGPVPVPFAGLPGGLLRASGSVKLSGPVEHLKLKLTVRGLPAAHHGHYEVWLYNSVIDSVPLGRLRNGRHRLGARLPANARHYRWIDVSFQPVGVVNHSGESELRASNPAHTSMARLHKRSSRKRHRLRQAVNVQAAHPGRPPKQHRQTLSPAARRRAAAQREKRTARGSSRDKTSK